jgi:MFS family permease
MSRSERRPAGDPPTRLVTRPLLVRFVSIVGASASFYLLLSTVPEYARTAGASAGTAGLTTTALTLSSVAAYLAAPGLIARYGYRPMLAAGLAALGAAGMLTLSLAVDPTIPAAVIAGAAVFGAGFGVTQNASLTLMYDRVPESGYSAVSALWNLAYDGGMGLGAAGFGVLAACTGYPAAFALTAAVLPAVLPVARPVISRAGGRRPGMRTGAPGPRTTSRSA